MKQLLVISILLLTFASTKAQSCLNGGKERVFLLNTQVGTTEKGEFLTSFEFSTFKFQPSFFVSVVGEFYSAKNRPYSSTTAQVGARINKRFLGSSENYRVIAFTGGKYATQGGEKVDGLNQFIYEVGVGGLRRLKYSDQVDVWLRGNISYNSVPGGQFVFTIGTQFHF